MHFRLTSVPPAAYRFICNNHNIDCVSEYKYLGLVLSDTLNYDVTAKCVAKSATRALGLLISKSRQLEECRTRFILDCMTVWIGL